MRSLLLNTPKPVLDHLDTLREGRGKQVKVDRAALHSLLKDYDKMVSWIEGEGMPVITPDTKES